MTFKELMVYLRELNFLSIFIRLLLASIIGGILGMNRARRHRPAGFRTHMLVCLGAAIVMLTGQYTLATFGAGDPTRLGAQVISGIGFLGAGTIVVNRRNQVLGLTTAAGLWASACIGLAIGIGFYEGALVSALFLIIIVWIFGNMDDWIISHSRNLQVYIEFASASSLSKLLSYISQNSVTVETVDLIEARNTQENMGAIITLKLPKRGQHDDFLAHLGEIEDVVFLEQL